MTLCFVPLVWAMEKEQLQKYNNLLVNLFLQTDIVFLDREIKTRKQAFGIEIYDLMEDLESNDNMAVQDKESKIRAAFDAARKDIAVIQAKKECKKEEMAVLEAESGVDSAGMNYDIPPSDGVVINNDHPSQMRA
uniref:Uncharacterized protein n=1 Tax=Amphora coffeiformis TaxID=265554 RepID=A0A7S3LEJ5_9STRA